MTSPRAELNPSDHVLVVSNTGFFFGGLLQQMLSTAYACTVDLVSNHAEAVAAAKLKPPTLFLFDESNILPEDGRALADDYAAPRVVMSAVVWGSHGTHLCDLFDTKALLLRPFGSHDLKMQVGLATSPPKLSQEEADSERQAKLERHAERERNADLNRQILALSPTQILDVHPPLENAEAALNTLVHLIRVKAGRTNEHTLTEVERDLRLITTFWGHGLTNFAERIDGDCWQETVQALLRAGFAKEGEALNAAFQLLASRGNIEGENQRYKLLHAMTKGKRNRALWYGYEQTADSSRGSVESMQQLLSYARTQLPHLLSA